MRYSLSASDDSCYPCTTVLINKQNIRKQEKLNKVEKMYVTLRTDELMKTDFTEPFTFEFYCYIHKVLFGDIYDWAGEICTVDISKKGTNFCRSGNIRSLGKAKFDYLQRNNEFNSLSRDEYIKEIADFYHELNMLHPFREGNGRTERLFFSLLLKRNGNSIDFAKCDTDFLMMAAMYAAQGVIDYLEDFFRSSVDFGTNR
ncbi:MAG: cell filamentation protein Fic [Ruminococcaceae bacterium]|nr:cell filamentation protein Fic [Oscillospiraceae bacterium]